MKNDIIGAVNAVTLVAAYYAGSAELLILFIGLIVNYWGSEIAKQNKKP